MINLINEMQRLNIDNSLKLSLDEKLNDIKLINGFEVMLYSQDKPLKKNTIWVLDCNNLNLQYSNNNFMCDYPGKHIYNLNIIFLNVGNTFFEVKGYRRTGGYQKIEGYCFKYDFNEFIEQINKYL